MRRSIRIFTLCFVLLELCAPTDVLSKVHRVTSDEALSVAQNWISLITRIKGHWAGSQAAEAVSCEKFKKGNKPIGYFCRVKPRGFVVISQYGVLAPVKAYSSMSDLNPDVDEGITGVLKRKMDRILAHIEKKVGPIEQAPLVDVEKILEINQSHDWELLGGDRTALQNELDAEATAINYQSSKVLLSTEWAQGDPFNSQVPAPPSGDDCTEPRCTAGCGPVALGQVMRHWCWPPYGQEDVNHIYDWPNMPDKLTASSPMVQIDAVAGLLHEIGIEAGADYCGGDSSPCATDTCFASCLGKDMLDALEDHFWYSDDADDMDRNDDSAVGWFDRIKNQINRNRPLPYRVEGHFIVADGWQEIGTTPIRQYHMNYGWANSDTAWYTLDELIYGGEDEERLLEDVYPATALGSWVEGIYMSFPNYYYYFDQCASGKNAFFNFNLQFLPGVTLKGTGTGSIEAINFMAVPETYEGISTRLFYSGDKTKGIRIDKGAIQLMNNGGITFLPLGHVRYLSVTDVTSSVVRLAWEEGHGDQDGFMIERKVGTGDYAYHTTVYYPFFEDWGVSPNTNYCYRIKAITWGGTEGYPKEICQKTPPDISISVNDITVNEGDTGTVDAVFTVALSVPSSDQISVAVETADGSAVQGQDYITRKTNLIFMPGQTTFPFTVQIMGDSTVEVNETFFVNLSKPVNAYIGDSTATCLIVDDD